VLIRPSSASRNVLDEKSKGGLAGHQEWSNPPPGRPRRFVWVRRFQGDVGQRIGLKAPCRASQRSQEVALGGKRGRPGINMHPEFPRRVCEIINRAHWPGCVRRSRNQFPGQRTTTKPRRGASGAVRTGAVSLLKMPTEVRWMGSGPRAGIGESTCRCANRV